MVYDCVEIGVKIDVGNNWYCWDDFYVFEFFQIILYLWIGYGIMDKMMVEQGSGIGDGCMVVVQDVQFYQFVGGDIFYEFYFDFFQSWMVSGKGVFQYLLVEGFVYYWCGVIYFECVLDQCNFVFVGCWCDVIYYFVWKGDV